MHKATALTVLMLTLIVSACVPSSKPPLKVEQYTLEYDSPAPGGEAVPALVQVSRFAVAPEYRTRRMVYSEGANMRAEYNYHSWRANPGDLATYFLRRDLTASRLFSAVLDDGAPVAGAYVLEGSVDDFYERDDAQGTTAVLGLTVALLDPAETDITRRVLFQRAYRMEEPCVARNPKAVAMAMSRAMRAVSESVLADVRQAIAGRDGEQQPEGA